MTDACEPVSGQTYLAIGQDLFSISEYTQAQYNYSLHQGNIRPMYTFAPAAAMVYTDLEHLRGLSRPVDYGSGIEYTDGILNSIFPGLGVGLQIGMWLNGTYGCRQIMNGELDQKIESFRMYLEQANASAFFIRLGYEFDNPLFGYTDPTLYVEAFQKIVFSLRSTLSKATEAKTKFVWHSWAAPRVNNITLEDYYPGDSFVDWIGVSIFQQVYPWPSDFIIDNKDYGGSISDIEQVLHFAQKRKKPTMIAESTAYGGIHMDAEKLKAYNETHPWYRWFGKVMDIIDEHDISMWSYINCNWKDQPMWRSSNFGDTRLSIDDKVMGLWHHNVINTSRNSTIGRQYLMAGSLQNCNHRSVVNSNFKFDPLLGLISVIFVGSGLISVIFVSVSIILYKKQNHQRQERNDDEAIDETMPLSISFKK